MLAKGLQVVEMAERGLLVFLEVIQDRARGADRLWTELADTKPSSEATSSCFFRSSMADLLPNAQSGRAVSMASLVSSVGASQ